MKGHMSENESGMNATCVLGPFERLGPTRTQSVKYTFTQRTLGAMDHY